jgi:hypothetical protein
MKRKIYKLLSSARLGCSALALTVFSGTAISQSTYTFNYTGGQQTISLPAGSYSIQCWGADGGNATNGTVPMTGGRGGYATGVFTSAVTATYNVYVGGHGGNASGASNLGGGGGGMSDIAPASNPTLIIIAAGGGGGATSGSSSEASTGGGGGGLTGGSAIDGSGVSTGTAATGGSQTAGGFAVAGSYGAGSPGGYGYGGGAANGGTLGIIHGAGGAGGNGGNGGWNGGGGGCTSTGGNDHSAGGGAGYYGGGGGRGDGGAGGGGSSYIGGVTSGTTIMFGQSGFVNNPSSAGNGVVLITELCSISIMASGNNSLNPSICTGQSLTLTTNAISNYSWSNGSTSSSIVVTPNTNTVYALTATSPSNCTASSNVSITVSSGIPTLGINANSVQVCPSQSVILTATGALTYTWTGGVSNGVAFAPPSTSVYVVIGANGCGTATAGITINVAPLSVSVASTHSAVCANRTATLMATAAATVYNWQPGVTSTSSNVIVSPSVNTVYTVTASDGTCSGTSTVSLISNPVPTILASASLSNGVCPGSQITLTATGGNNYTWSPGSLPSSSVIVVTPTNSTLYTVDGDNSFGCVSQANQVVITSPSPTITTSASSVFVCAGDQVTITASGGVSYTWTSPSSSNAAVVVNPTSTTIYTVVGSNTANCTASKTMAIDVFLYADVITGNTVICNGNTANLVSNIPGGGQALTYNWVGSQFSSGNSANYTPSVTSVFTLATTNFSNGLTCANNSTFQITVNPKPNISAMSGKPQFCKGETNTISATGALNYTWTGTGSSNTSSFVITGSSGPPLLQYSVVGVDANGCTNSAAVTVTVNACAGVSEIGPANAITVYPNPSCGDITLQSVRAVQLYVTNELGQLVNTISLNERNNYQTTLTGLSEGIYFITGGTDRSTQKLIITR